MAVNLNLKYQTSEEVIDADRLTSLLCFSIVYEYRALNLNLKYQTCDDVMDTVRLTNLLCFVIVYERIALNLNLKYWTYEEVIDTDRLPSLLCYSIVCERKQVLQHRPWRKRGVVRSKLQVTSFASFTIKVRCDWRKDRRCHGAQLNDIQHNDIQHNVTQHNGFACYTQHNNIATNSAECRYAECPV